MRIRGLEQNIQDFKDRKNYLENTLDTLNNTITSLKKDIEKKDRQIKTYNEAINNKNDELLQTQKVMGAMSVLNHGLKGDIEKLKDNLQGAIDKGIEVGLTAKEHEKHLLNDIALYFNWVKDLDKNLKELEVEKQKWESLRDQELADLRQERDEWKNQFPNQTPEQVQEKINNLQTELDKELSWWDKWANDKYGTSKESFESNRSCLVDFLCKKMFSYSKVDELQLLRYEISLISKNKKEQELVLRCRDANNNYSTFALKYGDEEYVKFQRLIYYIMEYYKWLYTPHRTVT